MAFGAPTAFDRNATHCFLFGTGRMPRKTTLMRSIAAAALGLGLTACGGGDGGELAAGNSQLRPAQIDAALGPADQTMVEDALPAEAADNATGPAANETDLAGNETEG